jgi:6-pyruvoyltetrahydropterin/6-carboxytetrahydropterin synthase
VVDLGELKRIGQRELVDQMDHKNLNLDVPFMQGIIPTTENLVLACWRILAPKVAPARLAKLKLWETENHYVEYQGR